MMTQTTPSISHDEDDIVIGEGVALGVPSGGYLSRAMSAIIDVVVVLVGYVVSLLGLGWLIEEYLRLTGGRIEEAWIAAISIAWAVIWLVLVPVTVETLTHGRSLGKLALGLRVVRDDGAAIGFRQALIRGLVGVFDFYLSLGAVAATVGLLNPKAKRLGDMLAGTYAQLERVRKPRPLNLQLPPVLHAWARVADVSRLPDRLSRRLHDFFLQAPALDARARAPLAGRLARQVKPYVQPIPDVDAETFLIGVTVLRRDRELQGIHRRRSRVGRVTGAIESLPHAFPDRG